jgi:hypothetical protein
MTISSTRIKRVFYTADIVPDHVIEESQGLVTRVVIERFYNKFTRTLDTKGLEKFLFCRSHVDRQRVPTDENGEMNMDHILRKRKPLNRDLSQFKYPQLDLTDAEKKDLDLCTTYKFQTPIYVAYVPQRFIPYVKETDLYSENDSIKLNQMRSMFWGIGRIVRNAAQDKEYYRLEREKSEEFLLVSNRKLDVILSASKDSKRPPLRLKNFPFHSFINYFKQINVCQINYKVPINYICLACVMIFFRIKNGIVPFVAFQFFKRKKD